MYEHLDAKELRALLLERDNTLHALHAEIEIMRRDRDKEHNLARRDDLTNLANRRAAWEWFSGIARQRRAKDKKIPLVLLDLDHFKRVNDECGHRAGDEVLSVLGRIIAKNIRPEDLGARWGKGDEFILAFLDATEDAARSVVRKIRRALEEYSFNFNAFRTQAEAIHPTFTYGVACFDSSMKTLDDWVAVADKSLYEFKAARPSVPR